MLGDVGELPGAHGLFDLLLRRRVLLDRSQAFHRVLDLGAESDADHAEVGPLRAVGVRPHRQRRRRHEAVARQFLVRVQVAAQGSAAHGEHGVVDRRARHERTDALEVLDQEAPRLEHAVRRHLGVEARDGHVLLAEPHVAERTEDGRRDLAERTGERPGEHQRPHDVVDQRAREQRDGARRRFRKPGLRRLRRRRLRRRVVQQRRDLGPAVDVDGRVVDLGQDRETVARQVEERIEPFDQVEFPQRARQVQRSRVDARGLDAELAPVARLRQRDVAHVVLEVEVLVLDPVREIEFERHPQQFLPEDR